MATKRPKREVLPERPKGAATQTRTLKVYKVNALSAAFSAHNRHLQALLKFYIESASSIPVDVYWYYFLVYMDNKLVGYATTFDEFQKVPKAPATISQVLVLPPYQKLGIGSALLEVIYQHYITASKCPIMVVEDPAEDFQRMKDSLDIKIILKSGFFRSIRNLGLHVPSRKLDCATFKHCSLDHREISEIRTRLKLKKENIQRCFELLLVACLDPDDKAVHEAYRKYVLRKFAESRDLLLPYFKFENFADRSILSVNNVPTHNTRLRDSCCLGDGQLSCLVGRVHNSAHVVQT